MALAFCYRKPKVLRIIKKLAPLCTAFLVLLFCYSIAKLLVSFEFYEDGTKVHGSHSPSNSSESSPSPSPTPSTPCSNSSVHVCQMDSSKQRHPYHPWLWGLLGWSTLCEILYGIAYYAFTTLEVSYSLIAVGKKSRAGRNIQSSTGESTPLLQNATMEEGSDKGEKDKKELSTLSIMWRIICYCKPNAHLYFLAFTFLVISSAAMSFIPYYTGQVVDHIAIKPSMSAFKKAILIMAVITAISAVSAGLRGMIFVLANARLNIDIRNKLFQAIVRQEIAFFDETETGYLISRLTSDTTQVSDQIGLNLNIFLRNLVQSIGSVIFMIQLTWKLSTVTLIMIPLIVIITTYFGEYFKVSIHVERYVC